MPCKIFLSCGQSSSEERATAESISRFLRGEGFDVYVAIEVKELHDVTAILGELLNSDRFIFVNFPREVIDGKSPPSRRGSLFCHQEVAIAYALGFQILAFNHKDVCKDDGLVKYLMNATPFEDYRDCIGVVRGVVDKQKWKPDYTRRLSAGIPYIKPLRFGPRAFGYLEGSCVYLPILNGRPDIDATCTAWLRRFKAIAASDWEDSPIHSPLKATGTPDYCHTIVRQQSATFDALVIGRITTGAQGVPFSSGSLPASGSAFPHFIAPSSAVSIPIDGYPEVNTSAVDGGYLNCALDVNRLEPIIPARGAWLLEYEFTAPNFPILTVVLKVDLSGGAPDVAIFSQKKRVTSGGVFAAITLLRTGCFWQSCAAIESDESAEGPQTSAALI